MSILLHRSLHPCCSRQVDGLIAWGFNCVAALVTPSLAPRVSAAMISALAHLQTHKQNCPSATSDEVSHSTPFPAFLHLYLSSPALLVCHPAQCITRCLCSIEKHYTNSYVPPPLPPSVCIPHCLLVCRLWPFQCFLLSVPITEWVLHPWHKFHSNSNDWQWFLNNTEASCLKFETKD